MAKQRLVGNNMVNITGDKRAKLLAGKAFEALMMSTKFRSSRTGKMKPLVKTPVQKSR